MTVYLLIWTNIFLTSTLLKADEPILTATYNQALIARITHWKQLVPRGYRPLSAPVPHNYGPQKPENPPVINYPNHPHFFPPPPHLHNPQPHQTVPGHNPQPHQIVPGHNPQPHQTVPGHNHPPPSQQHINIPSHPHPNPYPLVHGPPPQPRHLVYSPATHPDPLSPPHQPSVYSPATHPDPPSPPSGYHNPPDIHLPPHLPPHLIDLGENPQPQSELMSVKVKALPELSVPIHYDCQQIDGITRLCQPRSTCFYTYSLYNLIDGQSTCYLRNGRVGVCCPSEDYTFALLPYEIDGYYEGISVRSSRNSKDYSDALYKAEEEIDKFERNLKKIEINFTSSPDKLHQDMLRTTPEAFIAARHGMILNRASQILHKKGTSMDKFTSLADTKLKSACRQIPLCTLSPYRNIDGSCNNLMYPLWGSTNSGLHRMGKPDYGDGVESPRLAKSGKELPTGRHLSLHYIKDVSKPHSTLSHLAMAFGQLVAHDLSRVAIYTKPGDKVISCCTPEVINDPSLLHPACYPIPLERDDPQYGDHPCMEFVRAVPAQPDDCKLVSRRDPMNQVTHALDCSFVYGSDEETLDKLRSKKKGFLRTSNVVNNEMLPFRNTTTCGNPKLGIHCFDSGDARVNQQPPILSLHTILHREHNRLAHQLALINPHWNDERLFQEARKILIAQIQHITYNEFVPLLVNYDTRLRYGLLLKSSGYSYNYDVRLKPNILCEFQAAAFRIGHSMVQNYLGLFKGGHALGGLKMKDHYFDPRIFHSPENLDYVIKGLLNEPSQSPDGYFSKALTLELFQKGTHPGLDLYAINLQRGRDIGVNGYNTWRERCGLVKATKFSQFNDVMDAQHVQTLEHAYKDVDDVDLYTAGVLENPIPGTILGPTFGCIAANQFRRIKLGDRFWYERYSKEEYVGFTQNQLAEIRKATLAGILCLNTKILNTQPLALLQNSITNPAVDCSDPNIPLINIGAWKEK